MSGDPAGLGAVDPTNPQSWNQYSYVNNNPLSHADPSGREDDGDVEDTSDGGIDDNIEDAEGNINIDLIFNGINQTIYSVDPYGAYSAQMDPWFGHAMGQTVLTNPILSNAAGTMNVVSAEYGVVYSLGASIMVGPPVAALVTGLYH